MKPGTAVPTDLIAGAAVGGAVAVLIALVLAATGKPADFNTRLAALEADTAEASRLMGRSGVAAAGAICGAADDAEAGRLQANLVRMVQANGLREPTVEVRPVEGAAKAKLGTLAVKLEATGSYEAALRALEQMGGMRPTIFIDTVDIASKTSAVSIALEGRAFCSVL